jgi:hypothetical protein
MQRGISGGQKKRVTTGISNIFYFSFLFHILIGHSVVSST